MEQGVIKQFTIQQLYDLTKTLAGEYLAQFAYPWEALSGIGEEIKRLGALLPTEEYEQRGEDIWVAKSAKVAPTACLNGPCIVGKEAEVRHCAFIRGKALIGAHAVVGNSTELKNVILFDNVQVPHYNYVGDSILGFKAHMGAGSITSNVKSDKTLVTIPVPASLCDGFGSQDNTNTEPALAAEGKNAVKEQPRQEQAVGIRLETGLKKVGAMLGDYVEVGCNSVLNPGTVVGRGCQIYPLSMVRGYVPERHIYKNKNEIVEFK